jgi:hypothetical protein
MVNSDEHLGMSRRPSVEDQGWSNITRTRWLDDREVRSRRVRSAPYTRRRRAQISWLSLKTKVVGFLGLSLKIDSSDLMICASKSP